MHPLKRTRFCFTPKHVHNFQFASKQNETKKGEKQQHQPYNKRGERKKHKNKINMNSSFIQKTLLFNEKLSKLLNAT